VLNLHNLYSSPNIIQVITSKIDGCGMWHVRGWRGAFWVLVGKPEGKMPLRKLGIDKENNIKMDNEEMD